MHRFRKRDSWTPKGANNGHINSNNDQFFFVYIKDGSHYS